MAQTALALRPLSILYTSSLEHEHLTKLSLYPGVLSCLVRVLTPIKLIPCFCNINNIMNFGLQNVRKGYENIKNKNACITIILHT